jgi:hypothetical protein
MQKLYIVLGIVFALSACRLDEPSGAMFGDRDVQPTEDAPPTKEAGMSTPNCELKNPLGTGTCEDGRGAFQSSAAREAGIQDMFAITDCADFDRGQNLKELGPHKVELQAYCNRVDDNLASATALIAEIDAKLAPQEAPQSTPAASSGGGCEYQGRNYSQGESIYYPIDSSSLFVFGQSFNELAGKSSVWQQCDCSPNTGHWFCV